jgi:putative endonuclease
MTKIPFVKKISKWIASKHSQVCEAWVDRRLARPYPLKRDGEPLGAYGERMAAIFLQRKGYFILERSYRVKSGEIDLVAVWKKQVVVFVEVKSWANEGINVGGPSDAVDDKKQEKISRVAQMFMKRYGLLDTNMGRADVIEIILGRPAHPVIRHIENAFDAVGTLQMYS